MNILKKTGNFFVAMIPFWIYYAAQIVTSVVMSIVMSIKYVAAGNDPMLLTLDADFLMITSAAAQIVAFIAGIITMLAAKVKMSEMSPKQQNKKVFCLTIIFTIGSFFVLQLINALTLAIFGVTEADSTQELLSQSIPFMFFTALFAPFVEELIFRGLLVTFFKRKGFSNWFTITAITLTFALIHSQNMMVYAFVFGLVLMAIRFITGDWKLCVVFHFIGNLMSCILSVVAADEKTSSMIVMIGSAVGLIIAIIMAILGIKEVKKQNVE